VTKKYGRRVIVDQLSLTIERGDIFGFLGQNGAGKSTTIRMALGLVRPTSGRISVCGFDISRRRTLALKRVGAIVEASAFYDNFSGWRNLKMLASLSGGATSARIEQVLEIVGLSRRAHDPVRVYSHGMRQRLGIAQALLPDPEFVILDEPTDGLDPQGLYETRVLIRRLRDEFGLTVMLSSHLLYDVEQICNRIGIIDEGRLLFQGTIQELAAGHDWIKLRVDRVTEACELLSKHPRLSLCRNGDESVHLKVAEDEIPAVNALLVEHGFRVRKFHPSAARSNWHSSVSLEK
jgi:ABC-2 type transport system ATP-binding protein